MLIQVVVNKNKLSKVGYKLLGDICNDLEKMIGLIKQEEVDFNVEKSIKNLYVILGKYFMMKERKTFIF